MTIAHDIAFTAGLLLLFVGCWWERPAAALIVVGLILIALPVLGLLRARQAETRHENDS